LIITLNIGNGNIVPEFLEARDSSYIIYLTAICAVSFFFIGLARFYNNKSIPTIFGVYLKQEGVEQILKENFRLNSLSGLTLNLSYFIGSGLCMFLTCRQYWLFSWNTSLIVASIAPFLVFIIETIGILISGLLSGENQKLDGTITNVIIANTLYGILFSVLALIWIMNSEKSTLFALVFSSLFILKLFIRIVKNAFLVFNKGVSWYYIILYFCTLEVLPTLVLYFAVSEGFINELSWI
jgi:hypothetical protein